MLKHKRYISYLVLLICYIDILLIFTNLKKYIKSTNSEDKTQQNA